VLLGCISLMGCGGVKTAGSVFLYNDCWEVRGLMMCGITVYSGGGEGNVYFHPILWRLCGGCVCVIGFGMWIESDCGDMSGQKSLNERRLCVLYSFSR